jgi:integrase/recombinase XerD
LEILSAIEQYCAHLLSARGRARATVDSYRRDLLQFAQLSGLTQLGAMDKESVLRWLSAAARRELSARSRARKLSALRGFVDWSREYGLLQADPLPADLRSPASLYLPHALSEAQVLAIINAAQIPEAGTGRRGALARAAALRDRAILETLYASGMRVSELCGLRLEDLYSGEGFALVTGKGAKQRLVPLGRHAIAALESYMQDGRSALCRSAASRAEVFLSQRGPLSRSQAFRIVQHYAAVARESGLPIPHVSPHTFRHSCATHMLSHGADLRLVQELLGHASLSTTQVYTHLEKGRLREVYNRSHPLA